MLLQNTALQNSVYLEVETVEELTDEDEGGEEDLQSVHIRSVGLTQVNGSLQRRRKRPTGPLDSVGAPTTRCSMC